MQFSDKFRQLKDQAAENNINATNIVSEAFVSLVKLDHVIFKLNGYKEIFAHSGNKLSDHFSCRLGKWVVGDGKARFGHNVMFPQINEPHARVHECINSAIELAKQDALAHADAIIEKCTYAEQGSVKLFGIFKDMIEIAQKETSGNIRSSKVEANKAPQKDEKVEEKAPQETDSTSVQDPQEEEKK
ncbi:CZB domain-containing protein [Campylobacter sp. MIT 99-7217]|uniref:CZB domain-containing protein n=1 Tax=Campylobacter sp. MIT 99-7217 TaxID=535091 RepID=UPI0039180A02